MRLAHLAASLVVPAALLIGPVVAETTPAKLVPAFNGPDVQTGAGCAVSGDVGAVGGWGGKVALFERSAGAWDETQVIGPGGGVASAGAGVALQGDTLLVGGAADATDGPAGPAAHVFVRSGPVWVRQASLRPSDPETVFRFTGPVALDGDTAVVGDAYNAGSTPGQTETGAVYVFVRSGSVWTQEAKLVADDAKALDRLGCAVAIRGDTILAGALGVDDAGNAAGAAYVFVRSGTSWTQQAKLLPETAKVYDQIGTAVALDGDTAAIGAEFNDDYGRSAGVVHVYSRYQTSWNHAAELASPAPHPLEFFGASLALQGTRMAVGAMGQTEVADYAGHAFVYEYDEYSGNWALVTTLVSPESAGGDQFGTSIAMDGGTVVVGAPFDADLGANTGSAWAFDVAPPVQLTQGAIVPQTVQLVLPAPPKSATKAAKAPGLYAKGTFDTGGNFVNLGLGGALRVGARTYPVPSFKITQDGRVFTHDDDVVRLSLKFAAPGVSKAAFDLAVLDDFSGALDPDGPLALGWTGPGLDMASTVELEAGKFKLTESPETLDPDTMLCTAASARCLDGDRDTFAVTLRWGGVTPLPASAPEVSVRFGQTFRQDLDLDAFRLKKSVWRYRDPKAQGVYQATFDFARSTATIRSRRCEIGAVAEGPMPLTILLAIGDVRRSVSVRAFVKGTTLKY